MFHGQWLTHSSKTLLQELGHSQSLYLMLTDCEDIHIDALSQKCNIRELDPDASEPVDGNALEENDFFTGFDFFIYLCLLMPTPPSPACCTIVQMLLSSHFPRKKQCEPLPTVTPINSVSPVVFRQ